MELGYQTGLQMFHDECWKSFYFGVRKSKVKVTSHENIASVGLRTLASAGLSNDLTAVYNFSLEVITHHANGSGEGMAFNSVCLSVCLFVFPYDIANTEAARITKRDIQMLNDESWKPIYFGVKSQRSRSRVTKTAGVSRCTLVSAGFF